MMPPVKRVAVQADYYTSSSSVKLFCNYSAPPEENPLTDVVTRAEPLSGRHKIHPLPLEGDASSVAMKGVAWQVTPGQGCSRREPGRGCRATSAWLMACLAMVVASTRVSA